MEEKLLDTFNKLYLNNKIGHAYLICNVTFDQIEKGLLQIFFKYILNDDNVKTIDHPDIFVLNPINNVIKKEQIMDLKNFLDNTSQVSGKKIYVINNAELLNASSANSLLKILEEPENNIYAFLLSSNISNILPTIKSRCQIQFISTQSNKCSIVDTENNVVLDKAIEFVKIIESKKEKCFPYIYEIIGKKINKSDLKLLLENVFNIYKSFLDYQCDLILNKDLLKEFTFVDFKQDFTKKLIIINESIIKLDYNISTSLILDNLLIELGGS